MANPLYWEDQVSSTSGGQTEMIVDQHAPSFSVQWGKGKYDDVDPNHQNLMGQVTSKGWCSQCDRFTVLAMPYDLCIHCQRNANAEEHRRMQRDQAMGSNKRSTHILTDRYPRKQTVGVPSPDTDTTL